MKQAREAGGGENRRGAEKARGRNEAGDGIPAGPLMGFVDAAGDVAMRGEILAGMAACVDSVRKYRVVQGQAGSAGEGTPEGTEGTRE
jgi:hypothetical protein